MLAIVSVDRATRQLLDSAGHTRFLRGMAVAYKSSPWIPLVSTFDAVRSFSDVDLTLWKRLGLNIVRLAVPWEAVQPREGPDGFDEAYLAGILAIVRECADAGIYCLLEAHQDLFGTRLAGNGCPRWAISADRFTMAFPRPINFKKATYDNDEGPPTNLAPGDDWGKYYASDACTRAFWGLYNDERVQTAFVGYWEKMATTFRGEVNVIGYELINEPFVNSRTTAGVPYALANRASTERMYLQPLYDRITRAIRAIDTRSLIFYEPATGGGANSGDGFKTVPGGVDEQAKSVMSFHSYGPNLVDGHTIEFAIQKRIEQVTKKLGGSLMLTEFDVEWVRGLGRIRHVLELCDASMVSWIGWQYKSFVLLTGSAPSGTLWDPETAQLRPEMLKLFSRPFPSDVHGEVLSFGLAWETRVFTLRYRPVVGGTSRISVNEEELCGWGRWVVEGGGEHVVISRETGAVTVHVQEGWTSVDGALEIRLSLE